MMRVVHDETKPYGRIALQFGLSGDRDDLRAQHSQFMFQPNHLRIEYKMNRSGAWHEDSWTITGPRRLKGGGLSGKSIHKIDGYFHRLMDVPDWVKEVAAKYVPSNTSIGRVADDTTPIY